MLGAKGDSDIEGTSGTDDTDAIENLLSFSQDIYLPDGYYRISSLLGGGVNFTAAYRLRGPGVIVASSSFQTPFYGTTVSAGTKLETSRPVMPHGGFLVGGSGPTREGTMIKSANEGIINYIPTRWTVPVQFQLFTGAAQGECSLDGDQLTGTLFTTIPAALKIYPNDIIWLKSKKFRIASIDGTPGSGSLTLKTYDGSTWVDLDNDPLPMFFWIMYQHAEHFGHYTHSTKTFTVDGGDPISNWADDHNLIIGGIRYEVTVDKEAGTFTISTGPGPGMDLSDQTAVHRWYSGEEYLSILRLQAAWNQHEMGVTHFVRPDFAGCRVGIGVGDYDSQYAYYLPYHMLGEEVDDQPAYDVDTNMLGEGYTYMTFKNGHVGIHEREPECALHLTRHFVGTQGSDDTQKTLAQFKATYGQGGSESAMQDAENNARKVSIVSRNNWRAPAIQGYDHDSYPLQICIQPEPETGNGSPKSRCHFGDWGPVADPFRFQFTGDVKFSNDTVIVGDVTVNGNFTASGVYGTTTVNAGNVFVGADGQLKRSTSSRRYKQDIKVLSGRDAAGVWDLNPVSYRSLAPGDDPDACHVGLLAEDVATVDGRLVHWRRDSEGGCHPDGVQYDRVCVLLLAELKQERAERQDALARLRALEAKVESLGN